MTSIIQLLTDSPSISLIRPMLTHKQQDTIGASSLPAACAPASISGSVWNLAPLRSSSIHQSLSSSPLQHLIPWEGVRRSRGRGRQSLTSPSVFLPPASCCSPLWIDRMSARSFGNSAPLGPEAEWGSPSSVQRVHAGWHSGPAQYLWSTHTIITERAAWG